MEERRKTIRRDADRSLWMRVQELEQQADRRSQSNEDKHARRRAIRHNCAVLIHLNMQYAAGGPVDTWQDASIKIKGRILDLSAGGASLFTHERLEIGQSLRMTIILSDNVQINVGGQARWVKAIPEKQGYATGVQFQNATENDRVLILRFLNQLDATAGL